MTPDSNPPREGRRSNAAAFPTPQHPGRPATSGFCRFMVPITTDAAELGQQSQSKLPNDMREPVKARIRQTVATIISWRRLRTSFFPADLFSDPAWDMLLDLLIARLDDRPLQISYVGIEAGVPSSTSLRWVKDLRARGFVHRWQDPADRRRELVELSDQGLQAFASYVDQIAGQYETLGTD